MGTRKVAVTEVSRFMVGCMTSVGTPKPHAKALSDVLLAADRRGHFSHGLNRLEIYVRDVQKKTCDPCATPTILKQSPSTAWVSGNNGLGPVVGNFCMDLAVEKAKESGVGWVVAKNSNHYGMAAWYSMRALPHSMMGMSFSNSSPLMSPTRSRTAALGTNPMSVSAPGIGAESFVLDMATTAVSLGKIEVQRRKGEPIPKGWAQDPNGHVTLDAEVAYNTGCLMPLGGIEENSGYKGYGLGLMAEIFSGISSGSDYGPNVRKWGDGEKIANLGHCFVAIDISCFAPGFKERMTDIATVLRNLNPAEKEKPVLVPGDPEKFVEEKVQKDNGIYYIENQISSSESLAMELGVKPMEVLK